MREREKDKDIYIYREREREIAGCPQDLSHSILAPISTLRGTNLALFRTLSNTMKPQIHTKQF